MLFAVCMHPAMLIYLSNYRSIGPGSTAADKTGKAVVVDLAPDYTEAWNRRAYVHFVRNDIERALGDLRRTLALDPHRCSGGRELYRCPGLLDATSLGRILLLHK